MKNDSKNLPRPSFTKNFLGLSLTGVIGLAVVYTIAGKTMLEKTLIALANPCGAVWLLLLLTTLLCFRFGQVKIALVTLLTWFVLTLGGNDLFSNWLVLQLEAPYQNVDPLAGEPFDTAIVLGGGTNTRINGTAQLGFAGDRVMTAARLFKAGHVGQIICTGTQAFRSTESDLHPREEAAEILIELGVPANKIIQIKGENTSQEMQNIRAWLDQQQAPQRIALITSAFHLNRAMRLAKSQGIEATAVPAGFLSGPPTPSPAWVVPDGNGLVVSSFAVKEYLARLVSR